MDNQRGFKDRAGSLAIPGGSEPAGLKALWIRDEEWEWDWG